MSQPLRQDKKLSWAFASGFFDVCMRLAFIPSEDAKKPAGKDEKPAGLLQLVARGAKRYAVLSTLRRTNPSVMIISMEYH